MNLTDIGRTKIFNYVRGGGSIERDEEKNFEAAPISLEGSSIIEYSSFKLEFCGAGIIFGKNCKISVFKI